MGYSGNAACKSVKQDRHIAVYEHIVHVFLVRRDAFCANFDLPSNPGSFLFNSYSGGNTSI